ncbi:MAG: kelch motif-containing protein [Thermoplasmata archaeon]|nr:kelch motif-containing protein [Thermoplasmata archaeon]
MREGIRRFDLRRTGSHVPASLLLLSGLALLLILPTTLVTRASPIPSATPIAGALRAASPAAPTSSSCGVHISPVACATAPFPSHPATGGNVTGVNPVAWTDISNDVGSPPPARYLGSMVWDPVDQYVLLFGGYDAGTKSDTWEFSHNQWSEVNTGNSPPGRYVGMMAWDSADGYAVLFGGYNAAATYYNDTWTYVHGAWNNITGTTNQTPSGRWRASMTYDASDGYVVMFGGTTSLGTALSDTWEFHQGNWTKLTVNGTPTGRYRASMTYDPVDNETVLFGGCTATNCPDSTTWAYHDYNWTLLSPSSHPSARVYYGLTYSTISRTVLLFGGTTSAATNVPTADTWNFTNGTWTSLTSSVKGAPAAIAYTMMAFDPLDGYTILYGGEWANGTFSNQTWALGPSILGAVSVSPTPIDLGQSAKVNATPFSFSSYVSYNYTALPPGCVAGNISNFTCTPTSTGTFPVNVTLNDSAGQPAQWNSTLTVAADPDITSDTWDLSTVTLGTLTTLRTVATGGAGSLRYSYSSLPSGCVSADVANLTCTPTQSGTFPVHITVTDAVHFTVQQNATLVVNALPSFASVITVPGAADVGQSFTIYANLTAGSGTAPFTYVYRNLPLPCHTADTAALVCTPSAPGTSVVTVNVTDTFGWSASSAVGVTINADPTFSSGVASPTAFDVGTPVSIWANASGGSGSFLYNYTNAPTGCVLTSRPANTCTPTVAGAYNITATATDAAGFVLTEQIPVVVNPALGVGPINATPGTIDAGQSVTFSVLPTGGTTPFAFAFTGLPRGCLQTPGDGNVTCSPTVTGSYTVGVSVTDASKVTLTSGGTLTVLTDPGVISLTASSASVTVNQPFALATDAANGSRPYSYTYTGLPTGCASTDSATLQCTPTSTGTYSIVVTVKDSLGFATMSQPTNVTVSAVASSTFLGLPGAAGYALIGLVVVIVAAGVYLVVRRRSAGPKSPPPQPKPDKWSEDNPDT